MSDVTTVIIAAIGAIPPSLLAAAAYVESKKGRYDSALQHLDTKQTVEAKAQELTTVINGNTPPHGTPVV